MIRVFIATSNQQEGQILEMAFKQRSFKVQLSEISPSNYLEFIQYKPDIIIFELGLQFMDQLSAIKLVRANRRLSKTPIIGYGNHQRLNTISQFIAMGITKYFLKPLKIGPLFQFIQMSMAEKGVDISALTQDKKKHQSSDDLSDKLLGADLSRSEKLELAADHIGKLLSFPFTVPRIVDCTKDSSTGAADLAKTISTDSSITTTILKVSNSIQFHSQNREIHDIKDAIVRVGFDEVKNIAISLAVMKIVVGKAQNYGFDRMDFWYHALGCAVFAEKIAQKLGHPNPSFAFLAGLLQDFGALLFDEFFHKVFENVMQETTKKGCNVLQTQQELLGFTHIDLCFTLFEKWKLPNELVQTQLYHQEFLKLKEDFSPDIEMSIQSVGLANIMSKSLAIGRSCDEFVMPISNHHLKKLSIHHFFEVDLYRSVREGIGNFTHFLGMESRQLPDPDRSKGNGEHQFLYANLAQEILQPQVVFLEELGFERINCEDPAEIGDKIEQNSIRTLLINMGTDTPKSELEAWVDAQRMVGNSPGKPECFIAILCEEDGIVRPCDAEIFGKALSKSTDLRLLEQLIAPAVQIEN